MLGSITHTVPAVSYTDVLEKQYTDLDEMKNAVGDQFSSRSSTIETEAEFWTGKFETAFNDNTNQIAGTILGALAQYRHAEGAEQSKRAGFVRAKLMTPKPCGNDIAIWRTLEER